MNVDAAVNTVNLAIIANISYLLRRKLNWDPAAQRFVGDDEANRMLAQPYRAQLWEYLEMAAQSMVNSWV